VAAADNESTSSGTTICSYSTEKVSLVLACIQEVEEVLLP